MPVENDTSHQNGQQDAGGGEGNGTVPTETSSQPQQAPEPNATIVNGTHAKVAEATEDQLPKDAPKDAKKTDGSASFLRAARAGNLEKVLEFLKTNTDINTCNANGLNALHLASKEGHTNVVRELLQRSANVDAATKKGNTALHIASLAGQEEIVKVLVQHQAVVNIQSQNGFTPLYMAAQENHDSVVRFLLANNANQSLATEDGFTPLAVALQQGHDKVVAVLLENDTRGKVRLPALHIAAKKDDTKAAALLLHTDHNPDVTSKSGFTPLHIASHYGNENIANLLIQRGADVNYIAKHQITPLHVASKWGKGNMVSLLIDKGANYEAKTRDGLTPLHCAARSGHESVVDMLLEKGAPITSKTKNGLAPLHMASQGDHVDAARILLYHKAPVDDVTVDFLTALHVAAHCGHVRVAKLLLDRKAEANARALNGFTPLHIACKKNRIKVVELLLKHGASIEATTESGLTPLHVASFMGCMNIVIYLLQHSATADVPTVRGETPLHLAARANQTDIIRILLRNGAQVDARAREQQTALHIASRLGNSDIVVLLLQHGAAVDATTKDHYTALHIAAKEGQEEVASVLLEHGASLTSTTKKGFTPLHLAAKYGNMKVARLLLQKDAPVDAQGKNGVTPLHVAAHYDHQNVALLLLDKGASPHATAKNGYTPLHIAARKNQMDIATTLLEYGASANAESKAGFTPLHLSSQEGHTDMATLLIEHNAIPGACAKNGLTPLHLCGQEDRVNVAAILVKHGAQIDPVTKAGYSPLHVACHFERMNMVRFLLQHGAKVNSTTQLGYTPLHQAAQQGHTQIVNLLLESKAEPNSETNDGKTALSIAQRLGYISVVETLKIVTETTIDTTTTTVTEEKYKVVVPETMHETFMSESEDEGGDDTMLGDQSYRYLTVDEMKSLGDDSLPIDVTKDEKMDMSFCSNTMAAPPVAPADHLSPQHQKEHYSQMTANYPSDNVDVGRAPILAGKLSWRTFLVSFMVDARGGAMRGCRHSGVRVIIPPRKAAMPMRVTCRYLKKDKLVHAPPLMEGEALASRILEMGPAGAKFLGPVIIEVPHFASLRGKEREIVILRSDNGETWREHTLEATEEAVQEVLNESFDGEELKQLEDLNTNRITRVLTTDFPQYFAIVTRIRQEVHAIGPEGGMVSSTVVPQVQAVFPQGALTKKIKVGLQAQPIPTDLVAKLLGNRVAVSPIVTVEPRRRKFHKPITLTIPVPQASSKGMINQYSGEAPTLRLLCSITGGTTRAQWEDVTGSTPLTFVNDCVSFTTTVSARFWLMDCSNIPEATKMATELYREAIHVPFMAKFVVFSKRHQLEEARMRVFCMTDDREDKTLEHQELFIEVAKSRDVEVLEGKPQFLEFAGNLVPVTKSGDQLAFNFYAFRENRLPFTVRVKDQHADPIGRVAFMRQPKVGRGDPPQTPICNLNIALPDNIQPEPAPSEPDLLALEKKYSFLSISKADTIHRASLRLPDISNMLGTDWVALAHELEVSDSDINIIKSQYPDNAPQQAIVMLRLWMQTAGNKASGNSVGKALRKINREDIVKQCIFNVEVVTDDIERAMAKAHLDQSGFEAFKDELGPSRDATLNRDVSLDVSYDEQDMMKEAESAEEEEENQRAYHDKSSREQHTADLSPTYESEEKKYAGEEKVVTDEQLTKEEAADDSTTFTSFTATSTPIKKDAKEEDKLEADKKAKAPKPAQIVPDTVQENKEETSITDQVIKEPVQESVTKKSVSKEELKSLEKEKPVTVVKEVKEEKIEEPEETKKVDDKPEVSQKEPEKDVTSTIKTEVVGGSGDASSVTTETRSYTTADDGTVQEHIIVKKQTTKVVDGKEMEEEKSAILQKLGEELGKLDEKLEEKFKKRKAEKPEDGFTQASVESSQMSSTRGTAEVSFPGADATVMQLDGALTQQMVPWIEDGRISHEDPPRQSSYHKKEHSQNISTILPPDQAHSIRTEERGCSPITVLQARHNEDEIAGKTHSRGSSHTITTTTSWGAPLSATTDIQIEDDNSPHCLQFTLHSESRVTLHAPKDVIQDLQHVEQHQEQKQSQELYQTLEEEKYHEGTPDPIVSGEFCKKNPEPENQFDKPLDAKISEAALEEAKEVENLDFKHSDEYRQRDCSDAEMVCEAEIEMRPSEIARVVDASEVEFTSVVPLSHDKTFPRGVGTEEAKGETPEILDSEVPAALSDDHDQAASEVLASSAHRPTTLMITSNSNESPDDAECTTNDPARFGRENDISQDLKQGGDMAGEEESKQAESDKKHPMGVSERLSGSESGAVPRLERPVRSSPRTTTLVKVKVEKRPVGSHSQVRDRSFHDHQTVVRAHSVEEEVRGLMQEVKEATSQIKQEVKELRQADTPTPDTPTPLREFKEFINREEEQELERLPTIKEICRESEEDSSGMGGTHEASQPTEQQTSLPHEQATSSHPTSGTKAGSDVGVVFTERKEYGGGVKPSAETTGGHSHISPSPVLHPSQSIQSSSSASFHQKLSCTTSVNVEDTQSSHDEPHVPSRPSRRHERTFSQATNIFTGAIPTETKIESKKVEDIKEEQVGITEDIKPYSERKQFWENVTTQSFESKNNLLKSETESDTDTTGTDGTVLEQKVKKAKVSSTENNDSEMEYLAHRGDPQFYENAGFAGTEKIDTATESVRERTVSPFEVLRTEEPTAELSSPEDIAFKDVSSKRALFEKEIKRQSMEIEESQSWKRSSKEYDETVVVSEESASSTLKKKEERESKISETIEKDKEIKKKFESKKDDVSKTDFKTEITSKSDKTGSMEDRSEVTESSKVHQEKMQKKEEKVTSELGALGKKSVTQRDASTEKREKEISEKEAKIIHEKKDSHSKTFSKSISKSEEKTESSSEAKETVHTLSTDDQHTSRDEMTEEDITRTEEPEEIPIGDKTTIDITEESHHLGDTRETVVRETTTTREGDQEQRVVKETKTQETAMADGSTIKSTSITTFTTQLETKDQVEPKPYSAKTAKEKAEAYVKQQMKSEIFSEEISSSAEDQSPEHKVLTPKDTVAPVSQAQKSHSLSSSILVPEEKIEDVVWEVSQERSETVLSETVEDIPVQQSYETQHVKDISSDKSKVLEKPHLELSIEATKQKLSEEEARKLAIEIVEEVKTEAVKRSPLVTPSQTFQEFPLEPEDSTDRAARSPLPIPIPESAFTEETTSKIEKYIQEQLGEKVDEKQLKLIESVTAKKTELLHRKLVGNKYQQSMEITDEDLRSSGAELSPIEHQMERLRQMTEEEDNQRYAREPSEPDESESSIIIHDTVDDVISSEYDQATQMISKTLDMLKTADIGKIERPIDTIEELPETPVLPAVKVKERKMSEIQEIARISDSDIKETARQIVKEVTELAKESEAVKQASLASDDKQMSGGLEQAKSCSPKSGSKPGSRKGSWMDDDGLTREFRKDYEDKKKMFKEEMTSDKSEEVVDTKDEAVKVKHQKSSESQKEIHMESSMTESMEESSTVESIRAIEGKLRQETVPEIREGEVEKKHEERSSSSPEEVVMRKKTHVEEFNRRSGTDFDTYSSSGESHYFTAAEGNSDSRTASRPCSSDVEALMSERTGTSDYDTALTSQDTSQYSSYSSSSREYRTAASSMSSRDSMKSIDSESSGNLASVELSEASETLVPSATELERDMDLLDQEIMEEDQSHPTQAHHSIIPQLTVQSDTPKSEDMPCPFDLESDEGDFEPEVKEREHHVASRMKRSLEMTFHPEPVPISDSNKASSVTESVASSLEESTLSEMSVVTVVEQERSLHGSLHSESSMAASSMSEQMASSSDGQGAAHHITHTDSGVLTTDTGDSDMALHSVTITATSVPSTTDQNTASMCTQVTSETRSQADLTESEQFFHANGPTEVDYVPEYDDEVRGVRPVAAPVLSPVQEAPGAVAGPSEGPQKVTVVEECYETEADQEYGQMMRESEYSDMAEAELQYSLEEQPESEMSSMLAIEEPIERPKTPEPGYVSSSRPSHITAQSLDEPEEFTEVDKRFSAIFSTTYEEREEGARSLVPGMSVDIPDITVTEHTLPMPSQYCYPDLEREEDFPECQVQAEIDASGQDIPATPGSQESASTCASRKSSSTDSEQGREYCLDDIAQGLPFESFEMVEAGDIEDFLEYEKTLRMHEKRMLEMSQIQEEEEEEIEEEKKVHTSPIMPSQLKAVKLETKGLKSGDSQSQISDEGGEEADSTIEEQRRWLELQFEESSVSNFEYSQPPFMQHVYSGPLEDIEEEKEDGERRDLSHVVKASSLSSTPEYDVLAGRKFFTRSGEHDDVSVTSLQEFENLEKEVAVDAVARRSSSGSQESLNGRKPESKSGQGDDISVGSFASLQEFERLEEECQEVVQVEEKAKEEEAMLSEIEEGHESQVSESESCETLSEPGRASVDGEEYDQRMFEIDEIIRQAQTNVEIFNKTKPGYEGVQLQDLVSCGSGSSQADRTPSLGREEGDADSLEEAQLPELDLDHSAPGATASVKQDVMTFSTDSIETSAKQRVPRETSQDSLEKVATRTSDPMATSVDSIDLASRHDPMTTSVDSLEGRRRGQDPMSASTDSIDPYRRDVMATSIDSLGKDDSSGRDADISSGSEHVRPFTRDGLMEWSTDSLEPTSSQATHAIYHQYDTDSIMSGSFASGCSNTLVTSSEGLPDMMTSSMYLPEGELPPLVGEEHHTQYVHTSSGSAAETVASSSDPGFSHSITRVVKLPPEAHQVTFTGPDAQKKLEDYIKGFNAGQQSIEDETVDDQGNVHIRRVTQTRIVTEPDRTQEHGFSVSEPSSVETEERDEHGNVTRVIRRTVVTSHTIEVDLDTGEPIVQPSSSTPSKSSTSASASTSSPSISRIPRPVTSPPLSRSHPPGPPPGLRGPCEPVPPSLEPNTVSGSSGERKQKMGK